MRYPSYSNYKPSGIEWLPDLPAHWVVASLRWVSRRYAGGTPDRANDAFWEEGTIPWINSGEVNQGLITKPSAYITDEAYRNSSAKWVPKGSLVMALAGQGKTKAMVAQVAIDTTCNQSMAAIVPDKRVDARFLLWWLDAQYTTIRNLAGGEQRDGLNLDILGALPVALVAVEDQRSIAEFLDRETAKIDMLVAKKRTLVEKLKEKRSALISRTVTRGLPPEAARAAGLEAYPKLKPSGVDWLDNIPEHWGVKALKHMCCLIRDGTHLPPPRQSEGVPLLSVRNIVNGEFRTLPDDSMISEEDFSILCRSFTVQENDVLLAIVGATLGKVAVVGKMGSFHIQRSLAVLRSRRCVVDHRFLAAWLQGSCFQNLLWVSVAFSAQPGIYLTALKDFPILAPPLSEQRAIADFLDRETAKIDRLVAKVEEAIERLQEYRTALITAAVTGKIDVRGAWVDAVDAMDQVDKSEKALAAGGRA